MVTLPSYLMGNYYFLIKTDIHTNIYEEDFDNNVVNKPIVLDPTPLCDIAVTEVNVPGQLEPKRISDISYKCENLGESNIDYWVTNGIYLSKDTVWDIDDCMLNYKNYQLNIPVASSATINKSHSAPVLQPGEYHYIVKANQKKSAYELNWDNNTKASESKAELHVDPLAMKTPLQLNLEKGQQKYLALTPPAGETVEIKVESSDENASNSLYTSLGSMPQKSQYDYMANVQSNNPVLTIPESKDGIYYILVSNETCDQTTSLTISAKVVPFEITKVNTNKGGKQQRYQF